MREFFQGFIDSYTERLKNPLLSTFVISLAIYNWRPLMYLLFSSSSIETKIYHIDQSYINEYWYVWPLITTFFYILVLPHFQLLVEYLLGFFKKHKLKLRSNVVKSNMIVKELQAKNERTLADVRAGTSEINELQTKINAMSLDHEIIIKQLSDVVENSNKEIERQKNEIEKNENFINGLEETISITKLNLEELSSLYSLLIDYSNTNETKIKKYLRDNLLNTENTILKEMYHRDVYLVDRNSFRIEITALLKKALLIDPTRNDYLLTEKGKAFVRDL